MAAKLLRCLSRKAIARFRWPSLRMMSDAAAIPPPPPVWLTLPPSTVGGGMVYNFYSLGENRVVSLTNTKPIRGEDKMMFVGSSNGWLALFNPGNGDVFLFDPITRRHVKLPPIQTLDRPEEQLYGFGCVKKVILSSSSPDEEDCRALMIYGAAGFLAICQPARSAEWTSLRERPCTDIVYSAGGETFLGITYNREAGWELEAWDPQLITREAADKALLRCDEDEDFMFSQKYLAVTAGEVLVVSRDISYYDPNNESETDEVVYEPFKQTHKTKGFEVYRYDRKERSLRHMEGSLGGFALLIGCNHTMALSTRDFPQLNPNSIYFTDPFQVDMDDEDVLYGGQDIGIFNYEDATFSSCYYPVHVPSKIGPGPMWFLPHGYSS